MARALRPRAVRSRTVRRPRPYRKMSRPAPPPIGGARSSLRCPLADRSCSSCSCIRAQWPRPRAPVLPACAVPSSPPFVRARLYIADESLRRDRHGCRRLREREAVTSRGHERSEIMKKFLVLYRAPNTSFEQMMKAPPEQQKAGMDAWMAWSKKAGKQLVDMGAPLGKNLRVTKSGPSPASNDLGGYSIMQAESKEA